VTVLPETAPAAAPLLALPPVAWPPVAVALDGPVVALEGPDVAALVLGALFCAGQNCGFSRLQ